MSVPLGATEAGLSPGRDGVPFADDAESVVLEEGAAPSAVGDGRERVVGVAFAADSDPRRVALDEVPALIADDGNFVWLDFTRYAEDTLRRAAQLLDLPRNAVHAALSAWQRPRLSEYRGHFFVSVTVPQLDSASRRIQANELDLIIGNNVLLSIHKRALPFADRMHARARKSPDLVRLDSAFMLYIVLDELLAYYEELNREVQLETEYLEERSLHDLRDSFLEELLRFKRYVFALFQLADQHRTLFTAFLRPDFRWISGEEVEDYFQDLDARLERLLSALQGARDSVTGAFDIYVSHVAQRTNEIMKVLTLTSTILLPATLLTAIFGATLEGIGSNGVGGVAAMLASILVVSGLVVFIFRRRAWM